jgi:rubredoxin
VTHVTPACDHHPSPGASLRRVKYMCESCGFIYDPEVGDPDGGIPPGTEFEDIPETWFCPVCGARKRDFEPYEE